MSGLYTAGIALIAGGGYLTGKGPAGSLKPKPPTLPGVAPMPDQTVLDESRRREAAATLQRTGRASTILSSGTDTGDRLGP